MPETSAEAMNVASGVHICRERKKLSARALSSEAGLSNGYVTKLETGQIEPTVRSFGRLARALQMTPMEVYACVLGEADA